ncbi:MAG: cyclic nucleotide-binding domain-containing protein [Spirochaetes bacterium]|nr:cyclic nucleotide-binding domain-containing protein [Spirochaetota bacterium]
MKDKLEAIMKEMIIFHAMTDEEIEILLNKIKIKSFETGQEICPEGEMGRELYVIIEGHVEVIKKDSNNNEYCIAELKSHDSFGEMSLIDVQKRSATIRAAEKTTVAYLRYSAMLEIYEESLETFTKLLLNIAREFSRRLRSMDDKMLEFLQKDPKTFC